MTGKRGDMRTALKALVLGALYALGAVLPAPANAQTNSRDSASATFRITVRDQFQPYAVTDLTGTPAGEKQVSLTWTAPVEDMVLADPSLDPVASYDVRYATFSVTELLGDATAWFNTAGPLVFQPPITPVGGRQLQGGVTQLLPAVTYYFAIRSTDDSGNISDIDDLARLSGGSSQAKVVIPGIAAITDVTGLSGTSFGEIQLVWTEPNRFGTGNPLKYEIRMSSVTQINNDADFANSALSAPLTHLSGTPLPGVGNQGSPIAYNVTGLTPGVTYYFAVKAVEDTPTLPFKGAWNRDALALNTTNFAQAFFNPIPPDAVTNLTALKGPVPASIEVAWTAPDAPGGAPIDQYVLKYSSVSVDDLGGNTTSWFNLVSATQVPVAVQPAGLTVSTQIFNLELGTTIYFGIKSIDILGQTSTIDVSAASILNQAATRPRSSPPIANLTAFTGAKSGEIRLEWTEPLTDGLTPPFFYDIRVSSENPNLPGTGLNINDNTQFDQARPLGAFSPTALLTPNALGGNTTSFVVGGLTAESTYYFAIRLYDSNPSPVYTDWLRVPLSGINNRNFAAARFLPGFPNPITDLTAVTGATTEGDVDLTWTTPFTSNFELLKNYEIRYANFNVDSLGGDTTAWWNLAASSSQIISVGPKPAGSVESGVTVGGLFPLTTFYFSVRAIGRGGFLAPIDQRSDTFGLQPFTLPANQAPAVPSGVAAAGGLREAIVDWNDLPNGIGGKGLDFSHYRLERSTAQDFSGIITDVTTTTAAGFTDHPLSAFTTFYFRLAAVDQAGLQSAYSAPVSSATPFTLRPQQPFGLQFEKDGSSVTLSWQQTKAFEDGTLFDSTGTPTADELTGYELYRSTGACSPYSKVMETAFNQPNATDTIGGLANYYIIRSSNQYFTSQDSVIVTPFGAQLFQLEDCASNVEVDAVKLPELDAGTNGYDKPILIQRRTLKQDHGGKVLKSVEFLPLLDGQTPLNDFHFSQPVQIVLAFNTDLSGSPISPSGLGLQDAGTAATQGADPLDNLGVVWHNGVEFKKLYGKVSKAAKTVTVETPNLGLFQLRTVLREAGVTFDLSNITSRVLTPNGDGKNDTIQFLFDNPNNATVQGKIYDLRGAFVADMVPGLVPNTLIWDGRSNGNIVTGGVYVYQLTGEDQRFNGTIVVAR